MLAITPALLDILGLRPGVQVGISVENGRLVVERQHRPRQAAESQTRPGQEVTIALTTDLKFRDRQVQAIKKATGDNYTWRVQVRRGFVKVNGKDVSATTVIGVDFAGTEIRANPSNQRHLWSIVRRKLLLVIPE